MSAVRMVFALSVAILLTACSRNNDASLGAGATRLNEIGYKIKQLAFSWPAVPGADTYRLLENPDGVSGYTQIGSDFTAVTTSHDYDISVHLQDWANASYILQSCVGADCTNSAERTATNSGAAIGYFKASNTDIADNFGHAVAVSDDGDTVAVGAWGEDSDPAVGEADDSFPDSGAVYVFSRVADAWQGPAYVKASNAATSDQFGYSVALSSDGLTLAVGAWNQESGEGAVYVFVRTSLSDGWIEEGYLKASNAQSGDLFGQAVALSDDGDTLVVGAPGEASAGSAAGQGDNTAAGAGAVYIFTRSSGVWSQQDYLKASNAASDDGFGTALSISAGGSVLAVAAPLEDDGANSNNGAAYVFSYATATGWTEDAVLRASNAGSNDNFASSLALSGDGLTLAVGTPYEDSDGVADNNNTLDSGAVYVFSYSGGWGEQAMIKPAVVEAGEQFGFSVALGESSGNFLAVGADMEDGGTIGVGGDPLQNSAIDSGAGFIFTRAAGVWTQYTYLKASNTELGDGFGAAMAMNSDGLTLAIGAVNEDSVATGIGGNQSDNSVTNSGAVYLY